MNQSIIMSKVQPLTKLDDAIIDELHIVLGNSDGQVQVEAFDILIHVASLAKLRELKGLAVMVELVESCNDVGVGRQINPSLDVFLQPDGFQ